MPTSAIALTTLGCELIGGRAACRAHLDTTPCVTVEKRSRHLTPPRTVDAGEQPSGFCLKQNLLEVHAAMGSRGKRISLSFPPQQHPWVQHSGGQFGSSQITEGLLSHR